KTPYPPNPFTTSTLQQQPPPKFNFKPPKTMMLPQQLYEPIHFKNQPTLRLITYIPTDSTTISHQAQSQPKNYIRQTYRNHYTS
ncbi:DNA topoisomerase, partial [Staphylococcus saprophyticus]|uniref:DNA topoisomerase n=1 Tax=Staphylococcus saprophyticus TaxID=29385 RepID=UPI0021B2859D